MTIAITTDTTEQSQRERVLDHACCPQCGHEDLQVESTIRRDGEKVGYKVTHDPKSASCNMIEWPIYDPEAFETDINQIGGGLSICQTCLSSEQHLNVEDGEWEVIEPNRDEAGQIICARCDHRTRPSLA